MNIIEVIPLAILPPQVPQLLSYFHNGLLPKGAVVEIPFGNRKILAVVVSSVPIEETKMILKKTGFQLKKIYKIISEEPLLTDTQFKIALWLSKNYFSPLGLSFKTVLPAFFADTKYPFTYPAAVSGTENSSGAGMILTGSKKYPDVMEAEIKKVFNGRKQVLVILPEVSIAASVYKLLAGRYETVFLHGRLGLKKTYEAWQKISSGEAEIIIGTRQALFAPFCRLGLILMEDPSNEVYKSDMTPKYNTRALALKIAEIYSSELKFIARIPDMENWFNALNGRMALKKADNLLKADTKVIDMAQEIKSGNFSVFGRESRSEILRFIKENRKILIFSTRKGYSSFLVCENCAFSFKCPDCSVPMRVHVIPESLLICHKCSLTKKSPSSCPNCNSYKLKAVGFAGSEKIFEEIKNIMENSGEKREIFMLDADSVKTLKDEDGLIAKMSERDSFICIATQSVFGRRLDLDFDLIVVPSLDSLTTVPDFRAEENLFAQFSKLLDFDPRKVILQTFLPESYLLNSLIAGDYGIFYDKELAVRKLFSYPPFSRLAKLSFSSPDKNKAGHEARLLSEKLKMALVQRKMGEAVKLLGPSPAFIEKQRGLYVYNIILKLSPDLKPDEILKFVPSNWTIDMDPKSIL